MPNILHCFKCGTPADEKDHFCKKCGDQIMGFKQEELKNLQETLIKEPPKANIKKELYIYWTFAFLLVILLTGFIFTNKTTSSPINKPEITAVSVIRKTNQEQTAEQPLVVPSVQNTPNLPPVEQTSPTNSEPVQPPNVVVQSEPPKIALTDPYHAVSTGGNIPLNVNLVANGDFSKGYDGSFITPLTYVEVNTDCLVVGHTFTIAKGNRSPVDLNHHTETDNLVAHKGQSYYMVGHIGEINPVKVWSETIAVDPNSSYMFTAWVSDLSQAQFSEPFTLSVNGNTNDVGFAPKHSWGLLLMKWDSSNETSVTLAITRTSTNKSALFGISDIAFVKVR